MAQLAVNTSSSLRQAFVSGAVYTTLLSVGAVVAGFARNLLLAFADPSGKVLGIFAVYQVFFGFVSTFVVFGGAAVPGNYMPKLRPDERAGFLASYFPVVGLFGVALIALLVLLPGADSVVTRWLGNEFPIGVLIAMMPLIICAELSHYILNGLLRFRSAAVVRSLPGILTATAVSVLYLQGRSLLVNFPVQILLATTAAAGVGSVGYCVRAIRSAKLGSFRPRPLPPGFWKFSGHVYLLSVISFVWVSVDQLLISNLISLETVGIYYQFVSIALLVRYIPELIGRMLVSSFSTLIAAGREERASRAYRDVARASVALVTSGSAILILFSAEIGSTFGERFGQHSIWLVWLTVGMSISALGNATSMLLLALGESGKYLAINGLMVAVNLCACVLLIGPLQVAGAIIAKVLGTAIAQVGLLGQALKRLPTVRALLRPYFVCQAVVLACAVAVSFAKVSLAFRGGLAVAALLSIAMASGITLGFVVEEVRRIRLLR